MQAEYSNFEKLDLRIGKIIKVEDATCKKPTYRLTIDFGELGIKFSVGAFRSYEKDYLIGKNVVCIVNLPELKMGNEISEVFTLGADDSNSNISFLTSDRDVEVGQKIY